MSTALDLLITHRYGTQGGAPAICVGADGNLTDCRWKARRGGNGYGIQHHQHLADLIDGAYAEPRGLRAALRSVRDVLEDWDLPLPVTPSDVRVRALHQEVAGCLEGVL